MTKPQDEDARSWQRVGEIFSIASELQGRAREECVARECGADTALSTRVRELLDAHDALQTATGGTFLNRMDETGAAVLLGAAARPPDPGTIVGRYRIVRELGRGGLGVVYQARDPDLERDVALKLLPLYLSVDDRAGRRLLHEARAASRLDHPNIATVYEVGTTAEEQPFISMAYYDGETLRQRLARGRVSIAEAVDIAHQAAAGIAAAHEQRIVHRDIKPENLIFGGDGRVRVLDFGIATVATEPSIVAGSAGDDGAGEAGSVSGRAGTVAYMSPEQTRAVGVGPATDIWSLGVVLYEMLAGRRPFGGSGIDVLVHAIRYDDPTPLRGQVRVIPPELERVVARCLEKDPARRFGSASELAHALRDLVPSAHDPHAPARVVLAKAIAYASVALAITWAVRGAARRYLLPEWTADGVLVLLVLGLPVLVATSGAVPRAPRRMTRRAAAVTAAAVAVLVGAGGIAVAGGMPRVTAAHGSGTENAGRVVVADIGGESIPELAPAVREALSVDLQQSGFVSVVSRAESGALLKRMALPDTTRLDLPLAREVAERAGAGAVITVDVSMLGRQYVLSGRAVEPGSGAELFAVRAAAGEARLLSGVEKLSREMRRRLGEERDQIRRSRPLPEVTTTSLQALRLYADADRLLTSDYDAAATLIEEALRADSTFAMGHRLAGAIATSQLRFGAAHHHLTRAYELRGRLTERESWHVEAFYHAAVTLDPSRAVAVYEMLLQRYPGDWRAANNLASVQQSWLNDFESARMNFARAADLNVDAPIALHNAMHAAYMAGRLAEADSLAVVADTRAFAEVAERWRMARSFAVGDYAGTVRICERLLAPPARLPAAADDMEYCGSADIASGRLRTGIERLDAVQRTHRESGRLRNVAHAGQSIAIAHLLRDDTAAAARTILDLVETIPAHAIPEPDRFITRTNLQVQAALMRRPDLVRQIGAAYPSYPDSTHWFGQAGDGLVRAAGQVLAGNGDEALRTLHRTWPHDRDAIGWRIWLELISGMAFELTGQQDSAAARYARAADPRYHTMIGLTKNRIYLPVALRRLVAVHDARGDSTAAAPVHRRLQRLWAGADDELRPGANPRQAKQPDAR